MQKIEEIIKSIQGASPIHRVLAKIATGEPIGTGMCRDVFALKNNPYWVVKVERDPRKAYFMNATEWRNWSNAVDYEGLRDWLAPCHSINETGRLLFQRRVKHADMGRYPKKVPQCFTDLKVTNFGYIGNRFVCCDYAYLLLKDPGKLRTAKWWELENEQ